MIARELTSPPSLFRTSHLGSFGANFRFRARPDNFTLPDSSLKYANHYICKVKMPPPRNGNEYVPFEKLIQLERINKDTFRSITLPFAPDGPNGAPGAAYGGHVFMQAAWAACLTVSKGFLLSVRLSMNTVHKILIARTERLWQLHPTWHSGCKVHVRSNEHSRWKVLLYADCECTTERRKGDHVQLHLRLQDGGDHEPA